MGNTIIVNDIKEIENYEPQNRAEILKIKDVFYDLGGIFAGYSNRGNCCKVMWWFAFPGDKRIEIVVAVRPK